MSVENLKKRCGKKDAFLVVSPGNRRYLTDFESSDGYLFVTRERAFLLADGRYIEAAGKQARGCDEIMLLKRASVCLRALVKKTGVTAVYTESDSLSVSEFRMLEKQLGVPVYANKLDAELCALRRVKTAEEKERIITAQRIAEKAFGHILTFIKPGVTEKDIRLELEYYMLKNGADGLSFETIAVSGKNTSMPHGVPSDKKIERGDFVTMDYGALYKGYHSDMTRTVAVGEVTDEMAKVYETVLAAQQVCLDILKPGVTCKQADAAARKVIEDAGYGDYFTHSTGHGVGIDIHEKPTLSVRSKDTLAPGDVVTDEPGIYIPGRFGVRIEDMVYITESGCENLTKCEKSLIIL